MKNIHATRFWLFLIAIPTLVYSKEPSRQLLGLRGTTTATTAKQQSLSEPPIASNMTIPLHAKKGSHHAELYIGSPPQRQTVILDTGSRMIAFPCTSCRGCGKHVNPYFDTSKSTTHKYSKCGTCIIKGISKCSLYSNKCVMEQRYTEGSGWSAEEIEDVLWFGSPNALESVEDHMPQLAVLHAFGCQTKSKGLFKKQYADGILGLALDDERSLITKMYSERAIPRDAFGLCFSQSGGVLSLGGTMPTQHHQESMQYTPISREHGLYTVQVVAVKVGNLTLTNSETRPSLLHKINDGKGCLFDSGTTDTHLPADFSDLLGQFVVEYTNGLMDFSSSMRTKAFTYQDFLKLPEITFEFANHASITMYPHYYMEGTPMDPVTGKAKAWTGPKTLSNRIYVEEQKGAVLGQNSMFGHDILFDATGYQIGIAKANCSAVFS
jgi:hypothetical protein